MNHLGRNHQLFRATFGDLPRQFATDCANLLLELAHPGLARVMPCHHCHAFAREVDHLQTKPVLLDLPRNQVALRNRDLLLLGIACQFDDFHTVEQRPGNRVQLVGCTDKQNL